MELNTPFDYHQWPFYIDSLSRRIPLLRQALHGSNSRQVKSAPAYSQPDNLVMDGSFQEEILNSGFDWRYTPRAKFHNLDKANFTLETALYDWHTTETAATLASFNTSPRSPVHAIAFPHG